VKELPDDLAALPVTELSEQRALRDAKIAAFSALARSQPL
jgi:hypothetical protein